MSSVNQPQTYDTEYHKKLRNIRGLKDELHALNSRIDETFVFLTKLPKDEFDKLLKKINELNSGLLEYNQRIIKDYPK